MKTARVQSRCECEALLVAELDEQGVAVSGFARDRERGRELSAPASVTRRIGSERQLDVGWSCPICTRNTLRMFNVESLAYRETGESQPPAIKAS